MIWLDAYDARISWVLISVIAEELAELPRLLIVFILLSSTLHSFFFWYHCNAASERLNLLFYRSLLFNLRVFNLSLVYMHVIMPCVLATANVWFVLNNCH